MDAGQDGSTGPKRARRTASALRASGQTTITRAAANRPGMVTVMAWVRHVIDGSEMPLADLLAPAGLVERHHFHQRGIVEVGHTGSS